MPRRESSPSPESLDQRRLREEQTARNLSGLQAEQAGNADEAIRLYERNAAEGFAGDWPYGRLVALYEKGGRLDDAERILRRAIEVLGSSTVRTPQDRRAMLQAFRKRLRMVEQRKKAPKAES